MVAVAPSQLLSRPRPFQATDLVLKKGGSARFFWGRYFQMTQKIDKRKYLSIAGTPVQVWNNTVSIDYCGVTYDIKITVLSGSEVVLHFPVVNAQVEEDEVFGSSSDDEMGS